MVGTLYHPNNEGGDSFIMITINYGLFYDIFTLSVRSSTIYGRTTVTNHNLAINITEEIEFN